MRTFSLISQKGGAGKSTLARQLAVMAGDDGPSLLIDRDPQATTSKWWARRQTLDPACSVPDLLDCEGQNLSSVVGALKRKPGALFIDTRPAVGEPEAEAARVADLVIVPVRPSPDDLEAVVDTLKILRRIERKAVIIVNAAKTEGRAIQARAALSRYPVQVCPHHIADRTVYLDASFDGRGVAEMKGAAARDAEAEMRAVWAWVQEVDRGE
ncbi:AAA family ATPase [Lichenibacterium ramalinae]|uniref:Plasmid partitioning-family protein n=1 Tax=Lichenibacterium ramalinae TaxID=2316527 RepID=A0A4Q2R4H8_9HYPH|nr:AAA family ATPase [Lichenibacterium ramalinae]RYB01445.1 plasmid partitioning-family protein [Lichenibacterium ramalinae]